MVKCNNMDITNFKEMYMRDNFMRIINMVWELNILQSVINILENMPLISLMARENLFGRMGPPISVVSEKGFDMIMENGFLLIKLLKFILDFTRKIKNKEVANIAGQMGQCMRATSIMT